MTQITQGKQYANNRQAFDKEPLFCIYLFKALTLPRYTKDLRILFDSFENYAYLYARFLIKFVCPIQVFK